MTRRSLDVSRALWLVGTLWLVGLITTLTWPFVT